MKATNLTLTVTDDAGRGRSVTANTFDITFGVIQTIMDLIKIDDNTTSLDVLKSVAAAWDEVLNVLHMIFPDVTESELKRVKLNDLLPVVLAIVKYTLSEIMEIPVTEGNAVAGVTSR